MAAFEVGAVDYVLKPVEVGPAAKKRSIARGAQLDAPAAPPRPRSPRSARLAIPTHDGAVLVTTADISHAVLEGAARHRVRGGAKVLTDFTLQELEAKLPRISSGCTGARCSTWITSSAWSR